VGPAIGAVKAEAPAAPAAAARRYFMVVCMFHVLAPAAVM
jgi:hypothetical protein